MPHGIGEVQVVAGVGIRRVQSEGLLVGPDGALDILSPQQQVAHVVPCVRLENRVIRQRGGPLEGAEGFFRLAGGSLSEASVQIQLAGFGPCPPPGTGKQAVCSSKVPFDHGLRAPDGQFLGSGRDRLGGPHTGRGEENSPQHPGPAHLTGGPQSLQQQQHQAEGEEQGELVLVVGVVDRASLAFFQAVQGRQKGIEVHEPLHGADVGAASGLRHGHEHAFVEGRHNGLSGIVRFVPLLASISVVVGNGTSGFGGQSYSVDLDALLSGFRGPGKGVILVVLAVGDDQDDAAGFTFSVEGVCAQRQGPADRGPL